MGQCILQIISFCFKITSSNCPEAVKKMIGNWLHKMETPIWDMGGKDTLTEVQSQTLNWTKIYLQNTDSGLIWSI